MDALCRWHVIVKYLLRHNPQELFFPVMTCAFWFNIVLQSLIYITVIDPIGIDLNKEFSEIVIVVFFFFTLGVLFISVNNKVRYQNAENWFINLNSKTSATVKLSVGTVMFLSFFILMPWAIYLM